MQDPYPRIFVRVNVRGVVRVFICGENFICGWCDGEGETLTREFSIPNPETFPRGRPRGRPKRKRHAWARSWTGVQNETLTYASRTPDPENVSL